MTFDEVRGVALSLPGVEEGTSYGTEAFKVRGKLLVRRREEGDVLVLKTTFFAREELMQWRPETFFTTPHYDGWPSVLIRFEQVDAEEFRELLTATWRDAAPKKVVAAFDAAARPG